MMGLLAFFLAKLLDPIGGLIALAIGILGPSKWMIPTGAIVGAVVVEFLLNASQVTRQFNLSVFLIGILALSVWAAIGNVFVRRLLAGSSK